MPLGPYTMAEPEYCKAKLLLRKILSCEANTVLLYWNVSCEHFFDVHTGVLSWNLSMILRDFGKRDVKIQNFSSMNRQKFKKKHDLDFATFQSSSNGFLLETRFCTI